MAGIIWQALPHGEITSTSSDDDDTPLTVDVPNPTQYLLARRPSIVEVAAAAAAAAASGIEHAEDIDATVGPGRYYPPRRHTQFPRLQTHSDFSPMASYDATSNFCEALRSGC